MYPIQLFLELMQSVQIPLQSLPTLQQINVPVHLGVICKMTEGALHPLVQVTIHEIQRLLKSYAQTNFEHSYSQYEY